jgi:hypothetical protein
MAASPSVASILRDARKGALLSDCLVSQAFCHGRLSRKMVESCEELSGDGDQGDHFWFSCGQEALIEGFEGLVTLAGDEGSHEAGRPHSAAAAADHALATPVT